MPGAAFGSSRIVPPICFIWADAASISSTEMKERQCEGAPPSGPPGAIPPM
jgi:hypothetical protein